MLMRRSLISAAAATAAVRRPSAPPLPGAPAALLMACRRRSSGPPSKFPSSAPAPDVSFLSAPATHPNSPYHTKPTPRQSRRAGGHTHTAASGGGVGRGPMKDRVPPVPTDLVDPRRRLAVLVDGSNSNLIPGGCTSMDQLCRSSALFSAVLPAVLQVGVPVLLRVFAHQLPSVWEPLVVGNTDYARESSSTLKSSRGTSNAHPLSLIPLPPPPSEASSSPSADTAQPRIQVEYFRVERFIPIAMQIEADARHLYELRALNKVEGVCYVCHEVDRAMYVSLMQEQRRGSAALAGLLQHDRPEATAEAAAFFNQYVLDELGMADELLIDGRSKDGS
ncbi:hypothetical protein ABL78_6751 [Leptomonas seymouri]|uniref:Uncharacterized protein n=1 Tax=Leptomonas seymouri TaxID=5684 RepID=A0A0N1PCN8_LEPSE|nr:hypothetical protein ABL78_6751 [Leptomonas seymouri]|eukprot:KPI84193.1 hypothetical protein ABL78_6751 [Leptomonas seymouri]